MELDQINEFKDSSNWNLFKAEIEKEIALSLESYDNCVDEKSFLAVRERIRTLRLILSFPEILKERIESAR